MAKVFRFRIAGPVEELVKKLRFDCIRNGVGFEGDIRRGIVKGLGFRASYEIESAEILVTVVSIPFLISWEFLEEQVSQRATDYGATKIR